MHEERGGLIPAVNGRVLQKLDSDEHDEDDHDHTLGSELGERLPDFALRHFLLVIFVLVFVGLGDIVKLVLVHVELVKVNVLGLELADKGAVDHLGLLQLFPRQRFFALTLGLFSLLLVLALLFGGEDEVS